METHEAPYMFAGNPLILKRAWCLPLNPGFTWWARAVCIEDDVVVTATGLRSLTDLPRRVLPISAYQ